ncbi:MAG TPA: hypothetical protein VGF55_10830 [Gemmataceae bacterium]|jgi:hypothetical protein
MLTAPHPPPIPVARWSPMVGHALTVVALALGGLSSFHALRAEVVELRSNLNALMNLEAEHTRRAEAGRDEADRRHATEWQQIREDIRELRADVRNLKQALMKGDRP